MMNGRAYTIVGLLLVGCAVVLVVVGWDKGDEAAQGGDVPAARPGQQAVPDAPGDRGARPRGPQFRSIAEAEQALMDFDMGFLREPEQEKIRQGLYRFRSLVGRIPEAHYSELAARLGQGADNDLGRYVRQMALYQEWGRIDFDAALGDLSGIGDERLHLKALHSVFVGALDANPLAAMKKAETLDIDTPGDFGEFQRTDLMDTIYDQWIELDPSGAVEWAKQASVPDKRRDQWIADGLRVWRERDPRSAERWRQQEGFEGFKP